MKAYLEMWKNMFKFKGRTSKKDFGLAFLLNLVVSFLVLYSVQLTKILPDSATTIFGFLYFIYYILVVIALVSLYARRLHDMNKSGLWAICLFIPVLSFILFIIALFGKGTNGTNIYGIDPTDLNHFTLKNNDDFF